GVADQRRTERDRRRVDVRGQRGDAGSGHGPHRGLVRLGEAARRAGRKQARARQARSCRNGADGSPNLGEKHDRGPAAGVRDRSGTNPRGAAVATTRAGFVGVRETMQTRSWGADNLGMRTTTLALGCIASLIRGVMLVSTERLAGAALALAGAALVLAWLRGLTSRRVGPKGPSEARVSKRAQAQPSTIRVRLDGVKLAAAVVMTI